MKAMTKSKRFILIEFPLLVIAGIVMFLTCFNQDGFTGSRVKNPDAYLLDIEWMNGTDSHTLELHEDDVLQIHFETLKGALYLEIKAPDGTVIYRGNGQDPIDFTVIIPQSGVYTVVVEARRANGVIYIQREEY